MAFSSAQFFDVLRQVFSEYFIICVGTFVVHQIVWLAFNLPYLVIADKNWFSEYKLQQVDPTTSAERWTWFRTLAKDHFTQMLPLLLVSSPLLLWFGFTSDPAVLPSWRQFGIQFLFFNVLEDTGFYWVHRLMHTPWMFRKVHYKHHKFHRPFSLVGEIAHPAEFLFNFLLPLISGPLIVAWYQSLHIQTFWLWISFRELRGVDAHSGYHLPFHPLRLLGFCYGGAPMHDHHHMTRGWATNFGGYKFWDLLMGTYAENPIKVPHSAKAS